MAIDAGTVMAEVRVALDKLNGDLREVKTSFDKLGVETKSQTDNMSGNFAASFSKLKVAGIAAFAAISLFVKSSVADYLKSEEAVTKLGSALRSTGEYSTLAVNSLANFAGALQGATKYEDEATMGALSLLMTVGNMTSQMAKDSMPAVMDFATAMGIDLETAATTVSKAMEGNVGALGRYGIKIDDSVKGTERMTAITKALEDRFGGLALAIGDTASGKLTQLTNAFGDVKEELGRATVTVFEPFIAWLGNVTKGIAGAMKASNDLREALRDQERGIHTTNGELITATAKYKELNTQLHNFTDAEWMANNAQKAQQIMMQAGSSNIAEFVRQLQDQADKARFAMREVERLAEAELRAAAAKAKAARDAEEAAKKLADAREKEFARVMELTEAIAVIDKAYEDSIKPQEEVTAAVEDTTAAVVEMTDAFATIDKAYAESIKPVEDTSKKLEFNLQRTANTVAGYFQDLLGAVTSLAQAQAQAQIDEIDRVEEAYQASLDAQLQAALEAAGVAEETEAEKYQRELDEAIATGDAINIKTAQDALTRYNIEQEYSAKSTAAEEAAEKKKATIQYDADLQAWQASKASALVDAARAIINIWSSWAWNPLVAGLMTAATAIVTGIQMAAIDAAKPQPPSLATGGIVLPRNGSGSLVRVAENGSAELMLNAGSEGAAFRKAFAADIAQAMGGAGGTIVVQSVLDGKVIASSTAKYFNKGIVKVN